MPAHSGVTSPPGGRRHRIGLIVDHPKRDLGGAVLLANALAARGVESALIPLYDQAIDVPLLDLDGLVVNFARPVNKPLVDAYADLGIPVWVLDTEGGVLAERGGNAPEALAAWVRESGYAERLAGYFFWGPVLRDAFVAGSGLSSASLHLTGCPRFDLTAPRWRGILEAPWKGYILANANFPLVNSLFGTSSDDEKAAMVASGWAPDYVDALVDDLKGIADRFVDVVGRVADEFPGETILVRPHPFENAERYRTAFAGRANVIVDGGGSVLDVIANARCVLHVNCGTAVEALRLGVLPLSLEFINTERLRTHSTLPYRASRNVESCEDLMAILRGLDEATAQFDFDAAYRRTSEPWFYLNDGHASDRIADVLVAAMAARCRARTRSVRTSLRSARRRPSAAQRAQAILANTIGSQAASRLRAHVQPRRAAKTLVKVAVGALATRFSRHQAVSAPQVRSARHPLTRLPLASVIVSPGSDR